MNLQPHPIALVFPEIDADTFNDLCNSIRDHGFDPTTPIVLFEGKILDGRNRYRACQHVGAKAVTRNFEGNSEDAARFSIRANLHRRHLNEAQRAMIADDLAKYMPNTIQADCTGAVGTGNVRVPTVKKAAEACAVSPRAVAYARELKSIDPVAAERVKQGTETIRGALKKAKAAQPKPIVVPPPPAKKDRHGYPMNSRARAALNKAETFVDLIGRLRAIKREVRGIADGPLGRLIRLQPFEIEIDAAMSALRYAAPYTSCPIDDECDPTCKLCGGTQWIGESQFESLPDRLKPKKD